MLLDELKPEGREEEISRKKSKNTVHAGTNEQDSWTWSHEHAQEHATRNCPFVKHEKSICGTTKTTGDATTRSTLCRVVTNKKCRAYLIMCPTLGLMYREYEFKMTRTSGFSEGMNYSAGQWRGINDPNEFLFRTQVCFHFVHMYFKASLRLQDYKTVC